MAILNRVLDCLHAEFDIYLARQFVSKVDAHDMRYAHDMHENRRPLEDTAAPSGKMQMKRKTSNSHVYLVSCKVFRN